MAGSGASSRPQCSRSKRMAWTVSWSACRRRDGWVDAEATNARGPGLATADRSTIELGRTASGRATAGSGRPSGVWAAISLDAASGAPRVFRTRRAQIAALNLNVQFAGCRLRLSKDAAFFP
jgi:hypothetical protein